MARWRRALGAGSLSPVAFLEAELRRAVAAGDAERADVVGSYLMMLDAAGGDPRFAELFACYAREGGRGEVA